MTQLTSMAMRINAANLYDYLTGDWPPGMGSVATRLPTDN